MRNTDLTNERENPIPLLCGWKKRELEYIAFANPFEMGGAEKKEYYVNSVDNNYWFCGRIHSQVSDART